jgi:hypothetical protein
MLFRSQCPFDSFNSNLLFVVPRVLVRAMREALPWPCRHQSGCCHTILSAPRTCEELRTTLLSVIVLLLCFFFHSWSSWLVCPLRVEILVSWSWSASTVQTSASEFVGPQDMCSFSGLIGRLLNRKFTIFTRITRFLERVERIWNQNLHVKLCSYNIM